jgi:hypothetical protein
MRANSPDLRTARGYGISQQLLRQLLELQLPKFSKAGIQQLEVALALIPTLGHKGRGALNAWDARAKASPPCIAYRFPTFRTADEFSALAKFRIMNQSAAV